MRYIGILFNLNQACINHRELDVKVTQEIKLFWNILTLYMDTAGLQQNLALDKENGMSLDTMCFIILYVKSNLTKLAAMYAA